MNILFIGLGGFIGTVFRYLLTLMVNTWLVYPLFPVATSIINISGAFIFGFLYPFDYFQHLIPSHYRDFIFIGILGGYTTFSTFAFESFELIDTNHVFLALANVLLQCSLGIIAVWVGYILGKSLNVG